MKSLRSKVGAMLDVDTSVTAPWHFACLTWSNKARLQCLANHGDSFLFDQASQFSRLVPYGLEVVTWCFNL